MTSMARKELQLALRSSTLGTVPATERTRAVEPDRSLADPGNFNAARAAAVAMLDQSVAMNPRTAAHILRRLSASLENHAPDVALLVLVRAECLHPTAVGARALKRMRRILDEAAKRSAMSAAARATRGLRP